MAPSDGFAAEQAGRPEQQDHDQDDEADREFIFGGQKLQQPIRLEAQIVRDLFPGIGDRDLGKGDDEAAGDLEAAARRMHTLRSNAGFICALDLMASAGELEKAIEAGDTDIEPALSAIGSEIDELVAACGPWL